MLELADVQERLLQLTNERGLILNEMAKTVNEKLKDRPILNQRIDNRETLIQSVELFPIDPTCQETLTLELKETNWGDDKPKEKILTVTSKVPIPSTGTDEWMRVYEFSLNPLTDNKKQEYVGGVRASHNTHKFTNETFRAIHRSIQNYQVRK